MIRVGASLSVKQCRNLRLDHLLVLHKALDDLKLRRFRLMSYWDEIEKKQGTYNFEELDKQLALIGAYKGEVTLCLGARQPRWPESHWPTWTKEVTTKQRNQHLLTFIKTVVERYKDNPTVASWQLENEALLKNFGDAGDFDRRRLRKEYRMVKELDPSRPVIMTTSTSWGIPLRRPIPDIVGFSFYDIVHNKGKYRRSLYRPSIFQLRAVMIRLLKRRPSFIHELQAEPWGPKNIWEMDIAEQNASMSMQQLRKNLLHGLQTNLLPIDLWGLEWWYWRKTVHDDNRPWEVVKQFISYNREYEKEKRT